MFPQTAIKLALVDDHKLFRKGLISLIEILDGDFPMLFEAENGIDLQQKIDSENLPEILLLDINMPEMDGFQCVEWVHNHYPEVKILVVSMIGREETIVRMLRMGVKGYLSKDVEPEELHKALVEISNKGFYYTDFITGKLVHSFQHGIPEFESILEFHELKEREREFIVNACSEMTYMQIADKMCVSPKTIDGYRNSVFEKLNAKSRVGLVMHAIKKGWVHL